MDILVHRQRFLVLIYPFGILINTVALYYVGRGIRAVTRRNALFEWTMAVFVCIDLFSLYVLGAFFIWGIGRG